MTDLDVPDEPGDLYEARGDVPLASPLMQGDVFDQVSVPGLSEHPLTIAIIMHPCSMRTGAQLRPKITVAVVCSYQRLSDHDWRTGHVNVMPLPHLTNWVEAALHVSPGGDEEATINEADKAFHTYLDEDDRRRRKRLQHPHLHSDLRRECRREISRWYTSPEE